MRQTSRIYTGLATFAIGVVILALIGRSIYAVVPLGLLVSGVFQLFVSQVSKLTVGRTELTLRHFLAAEMVLGGLVFGGAAAVMVIRIGTGLIRAADFVLVLLPLGFMVWLFFNAYQLVNEVTPVGYIDIEPNVDRELQLF